MKKLVLICTILLGLSSTAQNYITGYIYQDGKLAFQEDNFGNSPFTPNLLIGIEYQGSQLGNIGYLTTGISHEYADLSGGLYNRTSGYIGFNFNKLLDRVELGINSGYGKIFRFEKTYGSFGSNVFLSYSIVRDLKITLNTQYTQRTELKNRFKTNDYHRFSLMGGIKLNIIKL